MTPPPAPKPSLLVVDDSRVMRKAISNALAAHYELVEAGDGEMAWELLSNGPDILAVITDVQMPRLDGYGLLARIRASDAARIRDLPVVIITGADDEQARKDALDRGATDFVVKPIDGPQLLARMCVLAPLDQTSRALAQSSLAVEERSATDASTGLGNKRLFLQAASQDLSFCRRHHRPLSVLLFAVDNFRGLSDDIGDEAANELLAQLAAMVVARKRNEDSAARLGGSEFALALPAAGRFEAAVVAERLRNDVMGQVFRCGGQPLNITISMGLATVDRDPGDTLEDLLALAGLRLSLARSAGGNRLNVEDEEGRMQSATTELPEPPELAAALKLLADGDGDALIPHLPILLQTVLPLLEFANRELNLGVGFAVEAIRGKLARP